MALTMADFETMQAAIAQNGGQVNQMIVQFYPAEVVDEKRTNGWIESKYDQVTGREIIIRHGPEADGTTFYKPHPWIRIRAPGSKDEIRERPMRNNDKERFPREWAAFQAGSAEPESGTPLDIVPFLSKSQVLEFRSAGVSTLEQLAAISDSNGQKFMDFQRVRQKSKDYIAMQEKAAPAQQLRAALEARDARVTALEEQIKALTKDKKHGG